MDLLLLDEGEKALTMKLYDNTSLDPYLGLSTLAKDKLITKKNIMNWQINTCMKYMKTEEIINLKEKLFSLDQNMCNEKHSQREPSVVEEVELLDSQDSLILSSKRHTYSNSNIQNTAKKLKTETFVGLSQECTYTTHNSEIIESDENDMYAMENGYIRGDTILTFGSEVSDNGLTY
ncbi:uncharacterized protein HGUI_00751 [Hanseniaspora guilliermondii]|uniref:Uncharacterized protein n=1 Tax=Hanseniaspora guilliermondii TaxID=56406 RepID=A0A1L0CUW0_9ASCO|nr:uncharacterized protein HGUI_00751 [Hanseniaspora guilliermondii]